MTPRHVLNVFYLLFKFTFVKEIRPWSRPIGKKTKKCFFTHQVFFCLLWFRIYCPCQYLAICMTKLYNNWGSPCAPLHCISNHDQVTRNASGEVTIYLLSADGHVDNFSFFGWNEKLVRDKESLLIFALCTLSNDLIGSHSTIKVPCLLRSLSNVGKWKIV